ncbi:MAG: hypothetical protein U0414_30480 [Polyangiaceae bacterium]
MIVGSVLTAVILGLFFQLPLAVVATVLVSAWALLGGGASGVRVRARRRDEAAIHDALVGLMLDDDARRGAGLASLEALTPRSVEGKTARYAALSRAAFARGEFVEALRHANEGLVAVHRADSAEDPRHALGVRRAFAAAAMGLAVDARGELRDLDAAHTARIYGSNAVRSGIVEVLLALASGRLDAARAHAAAADDLALDGLSALIVELVLAQGRERAWLREELESSDARDFALALAPDLLDDVGVPGSVRGQTDEPSDDDDEEDDSSRRVDLNQRA